MVKAPITGGGGQADDRGNLFVGTGRTVSILDSAHRVTGTFAVAGNAVDVAPAPDGNSAYVVIAEGNRYVPKRYVKGADGGWALDAAFKLEQFPYGGRMHDAEGMRIATDAKGNLFIADGMWTSNSLNTVIKFDAQGAYVTRFGEYIEGNPGDASSWEQGRFYWGLGGIAVSRDGTSVFTTEVGNNRVQRWDAQESGQYTSTKMWGATQETDPNRVGSSEPGRFAAPYDIGIDQWGDVYVMNTTVSQIQKFTGDGEHVLSMTVGREDQRAHTIAVDAEGNAISTETGQMIRRTADETREVPPMRDAPTPDTTRPVIVGVKVPAETANAIVRVKVDATDDRRPSLIRAAGEDGAWGEWKPFVPELDVTLSDGPGVKGIYVQVMDAAGNESDATYTTLLRTA